MNTLKFCSKNLENEKATGVAEKAKAEFSDVAVEVEPCLGHCDRCQEKFIALANEELVTGDTTHVLFERAKNIIGERAVATSKPR